MSQRIDWKDQRDRIDLAAVTTNLLGPAPGRRGERGRRLWWLCPFHQDRNPSFCVDPTRQWWRCYGCNANGDAATLVMRLKGMSFPEAVATLAGGLTSSGTTRPLNQPNTPPKREPRSESRPAGLSPEAAARLVDEAATRLWSPEGQRALAYLHSRGLVDETIRKARLGYTRPIRLSGNPSGIVVPWFNGSTLTLIKIRQADGRRPKYYEAFRDRERHSGIYPGPEVIRPSQPLVIPEGEFDGLLLGQELEELASVVTLGSASTRPETAMLETMLIAAPWYIATDSDAAGDKAADGWPARARRVRPPGMFNDWGDVHRGGVNLRRWWSDRLGGDEAPPLFTWNEAAALRWGPALDDPTPGIIIDKPNLERMRAALNSAVKDDYAIAERLAIQAEAEG